LRDDEISILNGVLELNNKSVEEIMTPMADVITLSADRILDHKTIDWMSVTFLVFALCSHFNGALTIAYSVA
jgi:CBS domain containing-hemolysin-like protein